MAPDGTIRRILVPQCGMAGRTPTVWELDLPTPPTLDGALASATDMATIRGTTRGGGRWATTDTGGTRTMDGEHGAAPQSPTFMEFGATPPTRVQPRHGLIPIPATTAQPAAAPTTTRRREERPSPVVVPTPTSTQAILPVIVAERPITRTRGSLPVAVPGMLATFTAARAPQDAADLPTTPTPAPVSRPARTMSMPAKTAPCTDTTVIAAVGQATAAAGGRPRPSPIPACNANSRCVTRGHNGRATSTLWVAQGWVAPEWVAAGGVSTARMQRSANHLEPVAPPGAKKNSSRLQKHNFRRRECMMATSTGPEIVSKIFPIAYGTV